MEVKTKRKKFSWEVEQDGWKRELYAIAFVAVGTILLNGLLLAGGVFLVVLVLRWMGILQ